MIALADVQAYVGAPPSPTNETYRFTDGKLTAWAWRDAAFGAKDGWWIAVSIGDVVLGCSWEMGGEDDRDRDRELAALVGRFSHLNDEIEVAA